MIGPEQAITIRPEAPGDEAVIRDLTHAAFREMPLSDGGEHALVDRLRADGDLALSLVAENDERVVGHVAFSPVAIDGGAPGWFGLAPVSVWPDLHRQGIGSALIKRGIADLRQRDARGIVVLGEPEYYHRFGFERHRGLVYDGAPPGHFLALPLGDTVPAGAVRYSSAFDR